VQEAGGESIDRTTRVALGALALAIVGFAIAVLFVGGPLAPSRAAPA
jgi:hypothetical protein